MERFALAKLALKMEGIKRFVYSSSQSMYGNSDTEEELEEFGEVKKMQLPLMLGPSGKQNALYALHDNDFTVVCFRPSTVFGNKS